MQTAEFANHTGVDLKELFVRVEYDRELLRDVLEIFTEEFLKLHALLQRAVERGDAERIQNEAHTLKGMLASLSFGKASASAMRIERLARQADLAGIQEEMAHLEYEVPFAQANLKKVCEEIW